MILSINPLLGSCGGRAGTTANSTFPPVVHRCTSVAPPYARHPLVQRWTSGGQRVFAGYPQSSRGLGCWTWTACTGCRTWTACTVFPFLFVRGLENNPKG